MAALVWDVLVVSEAAVRAAVLWIEEGDGSSSPPPGLWRCCYLQQEFMLLSSAGVPGRSVCLLRMHVSMLERGLAAGRELRQSGQSALVVSSGNLWQLLPPRPVPLTPGEGTYGSWLPVAGGHRMPLTPEPPSPRTPEEYVEGCKLSFYFTFFLGLISKHCFFLSKTAFATLCVGECRSALWPAASGSGASGTC